VRKGQFNAYISGYGVGKSKDKGTPSVNVAFHVDVDGNQENITWFGYLTDKSKARTFETLYKLGWNGDLDGLAEGSSSKCFREGVEFNVTIDSESYNGDEKFKVKWINLIGEVHGVPSCEKSEAMSILEQFKADALSAKPKDLPPAPTSEEDIPF